MSIDCWSILISVIGIIATGLLAWYIYKRTTDMTKEMKDFLVVLITEASSNPKKMREMLNERVRTGRWTGYKDIASRFVLKLPDKDNDN